MQQLLKPVASHAADHYFCGVGHRCDGGLVLYRRAVNFRVDCTRGVISPRRFVLPISCINVTGGCTDRRSIHGRTKCADDETSNYRLRAERQLSCHYSVTSNNAVACTAKIGPGAFYWRKIACCPFSGGDLSKETRRSTVRRTLSGVATSAPLDCRVATLYASPDTIVHFNCSCAKLPKYSGYMLPPCTEMYHTCTTFNTLFL